ncbi:hypothetical protein EUGRSUZ_L01205 [Eucalyptus grandis]|uniref:Uncharacterized protein n=1 Tax=Eucalyptus grandis TaxID=71139 RepID=A0A058ZUX6_EUCGR|nr:hypothetical protein EUGRSUZ_L01205 [Eucalyptus grandis]
MEELKQLALQRLFHPPPKWSSICWPWQRKARISKTHCRPPEQISAHEMKRQYCRREKTKAKCSGSRPQPLSFDDDSKSYQIMLER